jgi:hypothetical protein
MKSSLSDGKMSLKVFDKETCRIHYHNDSSDDDNGKED